MPVNNIHEQTLQLARAKEKIIDRYLGAAIAEKTTKEQQALREANLQLETAINYFERGTAKNAPDSSKRHEIIEKYKAKQLEAQIKLIQARENVILETLNDAHHSCAIALTRLAALENAILPAMHKTLEQVTFTEHTHDGRFVFDAISNIKRAFANIPTTVATIPEAFQCLIQSLAIQSMAEIKTKENAIKFLEQIEIKLDSVFKQMKNLNDQIQVLIKAASEFEGYDITALVGLENEIQTMLKIITNTPLEIDHLHKLSEQLEERMMRIIPSLSEQDFSLQFLSLQKALHQDKTSLLNALQTVLSNKLPAASFWEIEMKNADKTKHIETITTLITKAKSREALIENVKKYINTLSDTPFHAYGIRQIMEKTLRELDAPKPRNLCD